MTKSGHTSEDGRSLWSWLPSRTQVLGVSAVALSAALLPPGVPLHAAGGSGVIPQYCRDAKPADLPLPTSLSPEDYEEQLHAFLNARTYAALGWCVDKAMAGNLVRDTGPFINGVYYGTHPAVRVYYSPEAMEWITGDREAPIKDGAIIIKEMFPPPAARYEGLNKEEVAERLTSWTVMVRDAAGAKDGWHWSDLRRKKSPKVQDPHLNYPDSGFGQYCIRCHASAAHYSTFSTTRNIKGFPGEPIRFRVDDSWRDDANGNADAQHSSTKTDAPKKSVLRLDAPNPDFLAMFGSTALPGHNTVQALPSEKHDRVVAPGHGEPGFLSSDQCMSCHGGLNSSSPFGPVLFLEGPSGGKGYNVSHYGEWRWSPMGLAGRDPIFHAQLDTEIALLEKQFHSEPEKQTKLVRHLENLCFTCHAPMGQRQLASEAEELGLDPLFKREYLFLTGKHRDDPYYKYGALGRDGVSCALCHSARSPELASTDADALRRYLSGITTGRMPRGEPDEIYGPLEDEEIVTKPMENALGLTPKYDPFIKSSRFCGSCHVVNLPNVDQPTTPHKRTMLDDDPVEPVFAGFKHTIEQATYLEWLNSGYQDEYPQYNKTPERAKSCQGCHMPEGFESVDGTLTVERVKSRIAAVQDHTHPEADHIEESDDINVKFREEGISRHKFRGLNAMLLMMFEQFNDTLGVRKSDYMMGTDGISQAIDGYLRQARDDTVDLDVETKLEGESLTVDVEVTNKAGHRFPSGVAFRRAFLELLVIETRGDGERIVWSSGRTNSLGALVDENGEVLPTDFFERGPDGKQQYQPHHEVITRPDQVQIYEELIKDAKGDFTTSFIRRQKHVKDNRLLPFGWQLRGPIPDRYEELESFIEATHPVQYAIQDADFVDGKGRDLVRYEVTLPEGVDPENVTVRATLYYQSIPPYWLRQRFEAAPHMPATQRLFYIASHLNLDETPLRDWKLKLATTTAEVTP